jgi:hypothetical protein
MSEERKIQLWNEHMCHEVHLFLYLRDKPFFSRFVGPYLGQSLVVGFLDSFMLGRDVEGWMQPHRFETLTCAEQLLLAERVRPEQAEPGHPRAGRRPGGRAAQRPRAT